MDRGGAIASLWLLPACLPFLAAVSAWDIRWRLIPDWACLGLGLLGLGAAAASRQFLPHLAAGAALSALGAFASWRGFWGWGDAKLIAACGLVCGPQLVLPFLFFTSLAGAAIAAVTLLMRPIARTWAQRPSARWPRWVRVELTRLRRAPSTPYGVALAEKVSRRVVLVHADTRTGALALLLGVTPNPGLGDALETPSRIDDLFLERAMVNVAPRLDLLASEQPLTRSGNVAVDAIDTLLGRLRAGYHYVIVDVPQAVRSAFDPIVSEANLHILLTEASLLGARDAARAIERAGQNQRVLLVHSKAGRPGDLGPEDFATGLRRKPDVAVPFNPRVFGAAVNLGKMAWKADARIEEAVSRVARELSGRATTTAKPPNFLARLLESRK